MTHPKDTAISNRLSMDHLKIVAGHKGSNEECTKELNASQGLFGLHNKSCGINSDFVFLQYTSFRDRLIILYSYFILIVPG